MGKLIIIGAGLSGLSAAIMAGRMGRKTILVSAQPSERSQSVLAEGGMNVVLDDNEEGDSIQEHCKDTIESGWQLSDPEAVSNMVNAAPHIVEMLRNIGVPFQMNENKLELRNMGGQKKRRTVFAKSSIGKMLMTALIDEARKYEALGMIERLSHHIFVELLLKEKECKGCFIKDSYTGEIQFLAGQVLIASGGLNGLFGECTTGTRQNTGDVTATVFRQGIELGNLEFIQFHPTTFSIAGKRCLISEAARGEGGRLFIKRNGSPWYFMEEKYPDMGNLMPRDIVTREMLFVCDREDCDNQVYLNMTGISEEVWKDRLSDLQAECIHYLQKNPQKEPIPIEPGIHYFMGGILVDRNHRTNIRNVYAAGECACQYHGANRLGGNSILGAIYGGWTAVKSMLEEEDKGEEAKQENIDKICPEEMSGYEEKILSECLIRGMGVIRTEEMLKEAYEKIEVLYDVKREDGIQKGRQLLGLAMLQSAMERKESRGAHFRGDFPQIDKQYEKTTVAFYDGAKIQIYFREVQNEEKIENSSS